VTFDQAQAAIAFNINTGLIGVQRFGAPIRTLSPFAVSALTKSGHKQKIANIDQANSGNPSFVITLDLKFFHMTPTL
jgi:hypothetical protein